MIKLIRKEKNYIASFSILKSNLNDLISEIELLHNNEKKIFNSFIFDKRKHSYLLGRISAKKAIKQLVSEEIISSFHIDSGIFSFPVVKSLKNHNINVSITHCDDIGISIAFPEEHPMGIDLERIDESRIESIRIYITQEESDLLNENKISEKIGYTLIWTIKEALSKILKTGLTLNFETLQINTIKESNSIFVSTFKNLIQYKAISYHFGNYMCSILIPNSTEADLTDFWSNFESTLKIS